MKAPYLERQINFLPDRVDAPIIEGNVEVEGRMDPHEDGETGEDL